MDGEKNGKINVVHPRKYTDQAGFSNVIFQSGRLVGRCSPISAVEEENPDQNPDRTEVFEMNWSGPDILLLKIRTKIRTGPKLLR